MVPHLVVICVSHCKTCACRNSWLHHKHWSWDPQETSLYQLDFSRFIKSGRPKVTCIHSTTTCIHSHCISFVTGIQCYHRLTEDCGVTIYVKGVLILKPWQQYLYWVGNIGDYEYGCKCFIYFFIHLLIFCCCCLSVVSSQVSLYVYNKQWN